MQKRLVAIATALTLVCVGLLAQRHESETAHAKEHSGRVVHAQALADHHEASSNAHLHGREVHEHAGECSLLATLHEPILHVQRFTAGTRIEETTRLVEVELAEALVALATYRLAPKTSPPSA